MSFHNEITKLISAGLIASALAACGGGGGGGGSALPSLGAGEGSGSDNGGSPGLSASSDTGTVTLLATDAPTDLFQEINLTVTQAEIFGEAGRVILFSGEKIFDLLALEHVTEVFSVTDVPVGNYNKIRLTLTSIELVFKDESRDPEYPRLPGNGKLDLNPRGTLYVDGENPLTVQLDFDAGKSLHIVQNGKSKERFNFRPVVFIEEVEGESDTKLIRQSGSVANMDINDQSFDLCLVESDSEDSEAGEDDKDCVLVSAAQSPASIFDETASLSDISALENGDLVTVVGRFSGEERDDEDDGVSVAVLEADLLWLGSEIDRTENVACSSVEFGGVLGDSFENHPEAEESGALCGEEDTVATVLQPGAGIYDEDGSPVSADAIGEGRFNTVDGYFDDSGEKPVVKAVLVLLGDEVNEEAPDDELEWEGEVSSLDDDSFVLMTDEGDRCVVHNTDTGFFLQDDDEGTSVLEELTDAVLEVGLEVEVFGESGPEGCLIADTILIDELENSEEGAEEEHGEEEEEAEELDEEEEPEEPEDTEMTEEQEGEEGLV